MAETTRLNGSHVPHKPAVSVAKLRSLARPGFELKPFLKSVTPFEIGALLGMIVLVTAVVLIYSFWILPDQVRFVQMSSQISENDAKIAELQGQLADPRDVISSFEAVRDSLDSFRGDVLKPRLAGRIDIIDAVSALTRETGVRLSGPVQFLSSDQPDAGSDADDTKASGGGKRAAARKAKDTGDITAYPSMRMTFSITGSYEQLRNFVSRFEQSSQFVIIDTVALSVSDSAKAEAPRGPRAGAAGSDAVTLELSATTYFRPDQATVTPVAAAAAQ